MADCALPDAGRSGTTRMLGKRSGVDKQSADARGDRPAPIAGTAIIQFGIFCCAISMAIVLAVAFVAS
jgi:hypothetical protein